MWPWALVILKVWRHSRRRLSLPVKLAYLFTLYFWEDMTYCSIYYALFVWLQTYLHFRTFLILHVTVVGYAVMVYCVAVDCKSKITYTGRSGSLAGPRQCIKPWLRILQSLWWWSLVNSLFDGGIWSKIKLEKIQRSARFVTQIGAQL